MQKPSCQIGVGLSVTANKVFMNGLVEVIPDTYSCRLAAILMESWDHMIRLMTKQGQTLDASPSLPSLSLSLSFFLSFVQAMEEGIASLSLSLFLALSLSETAQQSTLVAYVGAIKTSNNFAFTRSV